MSMTESTLRRASVPLVVLGIAVLACGVVLQSRGVVLPERLTALVGSATTFGALSRIGGALAIVGLIAACLRQLRSDDALDDRLSALGRDAPKSAPAGSTPAEDASDLPYAITPQRMADWQRRLAEKAAAAAPQDDVVPPRRLTGQLHRAALVIVGIAFAGLLAITVWNQVAFTLDQPADAAAVAPVAATPLTPAERADALATLVADGLVPDAPADRHWTQIDLSGAVEWVVSRGLLALAGDTAAMMQIGALAGGVLFVIIGLFVFVSLRRVGNANRGRRDVQSLGYH